MLRSDTHFVSYGVFDSSHFAFFIVSLPPQDISGFFKLPYNSADRVNARLFSKSTAWAYAKRDAALR